MNIPKGLPCQHTFCAPCLDKFIRAVDDNGEEPQCPKCKAGFFVPKGGARKLPTNFSVQEMIELKLHQETPLQHSARKPVEKSKHSTCVQHAGKRVIMVCMECEIELCVDCMKSLHKSKHSKHALEDIETYLSNYKNEFERLKERSQKLPNLYDQAQRAADRNLGNVKRERECEIDQKAERVIQQVRTWQKAQKHAIYRPDVYSWDLHNHKVNSTAIKCFTSSVDILDKSAFKKLPSRKRVNDAMRELDKLEKRCQNLGNTTYRKPLIVPLKL